jgi:uncharacterized protein YjbI with pentapeptide repeats
MFYRALATWLFGLATLLCVGCDSSRPSSVAQSTDTGREVAASPDSSKKAETESASSSASIQSTTALDAAGVKLTRDAKGEVTGADLRGCKLDDALLTEIAKLTTLQQLDLRECILSNSQLAIAVKPLGKLKALRLSGKGGATTVDDDGLAVLSNCPELRVLAADELWFSEEGLKKLSGCKNLSELYIAQTLIEDAAMPTVASFEQLKKLRLAKTQVSVTGLKALAGLKLEDLDLSECSQINDGAMEAVAAFKTLKRLNLWRDPITDAGCSKLAGLTQLTWYNLDNTQLTDAGLDHLAGMTELTFLHLGSTSVSDAGMPKLLGLKKLKDLKVTRTSTTEAGAKLLTDKLPGLEVQVKYREEPAL